MTVCFARKGFTLVELLVVISIIALLASILMPALSEARGQAMIATCGNNMHTTGVAILEYSAAYGRDEPWLFLAGSGTGSFEDEYGNPIGQPGYLQPGNPALAMCHPYGPQAFEWFLDDARSLFCFASRYTYEVNYVYHQEELQTNPMPPCKHAPSYVPEMARCWGTYRYGYRTIPRDEDPYDGVTHMNKITADTPKRARDITMYDWQTDFHNYAHYNVSRKDGSVELIGMSWADLEVYLWGEARTPTP